MHMHTLILQYLAHSLYVRFESVSKCVVKVVIMSLLTIIVLIIALLTIIVLIITLLTILHSLKHFERYKLKPFFSFQVCSPFSSNSHLP